jgi:afadin
VRLEEDEELGLAFMLPEDGYSCDVVRGLPQGLPEFLGMLQRSGLCRMVPQPNSAGIWTIYMHPPPSAARGPPPDAPEHVFQTPNPAAQQHQQLQQHQQQQQTPGRPPSAAGSGSTAPGGKQQQQRPEVKTIRLQKSNSGMGLSIVAAKGVGQDRLGIYVKSVVKGGAADQDGRLQAGDQLLQVDGHSLVGITQEK